MKIAVVQASSQISKNDMLFQYTKMYAKDSEVINYGCFWDDVEKYSYLEIALLIGMLINDKQWKCNFSSVRRRIHIFRRKKFGGNNKGIIFGAIWRRIS